MPSSLNSTPPLIVRTPDPNVIVRLLVERLVRTRGVVVDDIDGVIDALEHFRQEGDLADQLIGARAARAGALPVLSFDQRFCATEGVELLEAEPLG
jgi:predicted nucleic-acid-binding protein